MGYSGINFDSREHVVGRIIKLTNWEIKKNLERDVCLFRGQIWGGGLHADRVLELGLGEPRLHSASRGPARRIETHGHLVPLDLQGRLEFHQLAS